MSMSQVQLLLLAWHGVDDAGKVCARGKPWHAVVLNGMIWGM